VEWNQFRSAAVSWLEEELNIEGFVADVKDYAL